MLPHSYCWVIPAIILSYSYLEWARLALRTVAYSQTLCALASRSGAAPLTARTSAVPASCGLPGRRLRRFHCTLSPCALAVRSYRALLRHALTGRCRCVPCWLSPFLRSPSWLAQLHDCALLWRALGAATAVAVHRLLHAFKCVAGAPMASPLCSPLAATSLPQPFTG